MFTSKHYVYQGIIHSLCTNLYEKIISWRSKLKHLIKCDGLV